MLRLEKDNNNVTNKLIRNYEQLGKALNRLDKELEEDRVISASLSDASI